MRYIVYAVAVLVAAGLIYVIGDPGRQTAPVAQSTETIAPRIDLEENQVALSVPGMHCAVGCFATVKEELETVEGIEEVELAKQKSETELDDKTVYITFNDAFKLDAALAKLSEVGFEATQIGQ